MKNCPSCGKEVSDDTEKCPSCGYTFSVGVPSTENYSRERSKTRKKKSKPKKSPQNSPSSYRENNSRKRQSKERQVSSRDHRNNEKSNVRNQRANEQVRNQINSVTSNKERSRPQAKEEFSRTVNGIKNYFTSLSDKPLSELISLGFLLILISGSLISLVIDVLNL